MGKWLMSFKQLIEVLNEDPSLMFTRKWFDVDGKTNDDGILMLDCNCIVFANGNVEYKLGFKDLIANDWYIVNPKQTKEEIDKQFNEHLIEIKEALGCMLELDMDTPQVKLFNSVSADIHRYEVKRSQQEFSKQLNEALLKGVI